jgi:hypothetical protein
MQFKNPLDPQNIEVSKAIKKWVKSYLQLPDDTTITITELKCCGETCPHIETVITIWTEKTQVFKIQKPLVYIRKYDVEKSLQ